MAQHSESTVWLPAHKDPYAPLSAGPNCLERCKRLLRPFNSLTLNQLGLSTLVYPNTTHLSSSKCNTCVYTVCVKGWHWPLTGAQWVRSTNQFRQRLTRVGIGHARLNNNLSGSPYSPSSSCLYILFYFHTATSCISQVLGFVAALSATIEEGENYNNTKHRASAYSGAKLKFEIGCKSPSGIIALVTG